MTKLLKLLKECKHRSKQSSSMSGLIICYDCGSTKWDHEGEDKWITPWIWRDMK